jgi:hypothetical protein
VVEKSVIKGKFRDYFTPEETAKMEGNPLRPKDFNYGNKLNLKEKNDD